MTKQLEETSLNAWPALQQLVLDGWLLRLANGYTGRANSVNPLYPGTLNVDDKIKRCEEFYAAHNQPARFKITPFVHPADLDGRLVEQGYQQITPTAVQTLDLTGQSFSADTAMQRWDYPHANWLAQFTRFDARARQHQATLVAILNNLTTPACFGLLTIEGQPVACGLAVQDGQFVGLFDLAVDPARRGQGLGRRLVSALLAWGQEQGASVAYLQVVLENGPAMTLYRKLGFQEVYRYWYRIKNDS